MRSIRRQFHRALPFVVVAPFALAACGGASFSAGSGEPDGSLGEGGPDGDIIVGPQGGDAGHDATAHDGSIGHDASADGPGQGEPDGSSMHDAGHDAAEHDAAPEAGGCPAGYLDCGGTCTQEGVANCGTCGHDCANLPHVSGSVTCGAGGVCTFTNADCAAGWAHCTGSPDNGCETSTSTSPNCGGCGVTCSGNTPQCNGTACVSGCTAPKSTLCNGTTCVDTTSDPQNCKGCGDVCAAGPANSTTTCVASTCGYACNTNYTACGGACVDEQTDPANCNGCGTPCPGATNGTAQCNAGVCGVSCNAGLTYCKTEGACVNETNDPNNCNGCGNVCAAGPANSMTTCAASSCGFTCLPGFFECDSNSCLPVVSATGAFVSPSGGGTTCTSTQPCTTIAAALATGRSPIYLDHGTYTEQVSIGASVDIQGGWLWSQSMGVWSNCNGTSNNSIIVAPASAAPEWSTVQISAGTVQLSTLTVQNPTAAAAGSSQSLYGIFATGASTNVTLSNVVISVAKGGSGQQPAAVTTAGASGTGTCAPSDGNAGQPGGVGPGATAGTYMASGFIPGAGGTGLAGTAGDNGTLSPPGSESTTNWCKTGTSVPPTLPPCDCGNSAVSSGTPGAAGCGGQPSPPGQGGAGGGASIGIFAWQATVSTTAVTVTTLGGGPGFPGGAGSATPGKGSNGTTGSDGTLYNTGCKTNPTAGGCYECTGSIQGSPGVGGTGGTGGLGGQGGGGAGGDSLCYATGGSGAVSGITAANCTAGPGGPAGGNGGVGRSAVGYP